MATPSSYSVRLGTDKDTSATLVEKGNTNVRMMTNNPLYPQPNPDLNTVEAACAALLQASETYAFTRSKLDKQARDVAHKNLLNLRKELAGYVQSLSKGDKEAILSAGFDVHRNPSPVGLLPAAKTIRAEEGILPGTIEVRWSGVPKRLSYRVEMCTGDPNVANNWTVVAEQGKNRLTMTGLESDRTYWFRVSAQGTAGWGPLSETAEAKAK